jgi:hypothetical protein
MVASNYAFANAWGLLKALPEEQGYLGTVPRPLQGLIARRGGQMGDVRHEPTIRYLPNEEGILERQLEADLPVEVGEGEGERVPRALKPLRQDITPIREKQATMQGYTPAVMTPAGPSPVGPEGLTAAQLASIASPVTGGLAGISEKQLARLGMIQPVSNVSMANIPGYEMMPEESFFTFGEGVELNPSLAEAARRQLTGAQRGGRMNIMGGSKSGLALQQEGRTDEGKRTRGLGPRRAANLGNVEGISRGARLGGRSSAFLPQEVKDADKPPTQAERLAEMAREAAMKNPNMQINLENLTPSPKKEEDKTPREENLETGGRAARAAQRVAESKEAQDEPPNLDFPTDEATQQMFADPSGTAAQAAMGELEGRMQAAEKARFEAMLQALKRQQEGRGGSATQSQIDRQA